jgi:hypothetical protein
MGKYFLLLGPFGGFHMKVDERQIVVGIFMNKLYLYVFLIFITPRKCKN